MANYSADDASYADRIVGRLLDAQEAPVEIDRSLVVSDLEGDAGEFMNELEFLAEMGADVPAARLQSEQLVPVALSLVMGPMWPLLSPSGRFPGRHWRHNPFFYEWARYGLQSVLEGADISERLNRDEALSAFRRGATEFLATRMAGIRGFADHQWSTDYSLRLPQRLRGQRVSTPGCNFTVSTNTPGLRVFWSGAYRISPNYFSHPTTPTSSVLQSGTYVFGVDGGAYGNAIQWDRNAVVTLPGNPQAHLNF